MLTKCISTKEARDNFGDLLGSVRYGRQPVIVEKKGKPFAVISPEDYERYQEIARERLFETIRVVRKANEDVDPDRVLADVTEAVEAVRRRRS